MSSKDIQNSTTEMEEGNPSKNELMDNRIPKALTEPRIEPKVKTVE